MSVGGEVEGEAGVGGGLDEEGAPAGEQQRLTAAEGVLQYAPRVSGVTQRMLRTSPNSPLRGMVAVLARCYNCP